MTWEQIRGAWKELRGTLRTRWNKLTETDLDQIGGDRTRLVATLQSRYGTSREQIEQQVAEFESTMVADAHSAKGQGSAPRQTAKN